MMCESAIENKSTYSGVRVGMKGNFMLVLELRYTTLIKICDFKSLRGVIASTNFGAYLSTLQHFP